MTTQICNHSSWARSVANKIPSQFISAIAISIGGKNPISPGMLNRIIPKDIQPLVETCEFCMTSFCNVIQERVDKNSCPDVKDIVNYIIDGGYIPDHDRLMRDNIAKEKRFIYDHMAGCCFCRGIGIGLRPKIIQ